MSRDPQNSAFLDTKAEVLYKMGRYPEAIEIAEGLVERNPDEPYFKEQLEKFKKNNNQ